MAAGQAQTVAPNQLNREFTVPTPDTVYVGDITYLPTGAGWLYLAVVLALCSRAVVGWSMANHMRAELVTQALAMATYQRQPAAGLIMHTDRGRQYGADSSRQFLTQHGIQPSMSRTGNCWDNAVAASFFHTLKTELIYLEDFDTHEQAQTRCLNTLRYSITVSAAMQRMATSRHWPMNRHYKLMRCCVRKSVDTSRGHKTRADDESALSLRGLGLPARVHLSAGCKGT